MRILALLTVRNEAQFIAQCLMHLHQQGVETVLIDNQSSDETIFIASQFKNHGLRYITHLEYPGYFELTHILRNEQRLAADLQADWFMHVDADEFHEPVNRNLRLVDLFTHIDSQGYNAINFTEYAFSPTFEDPNHDHAHFQETMRSYYPFQPRQYHRVNAWKKQPAINLITGAGHRVRFDGINIYPEPQVMRHYICLGKKHAIEKYCKRKYSPLEVTNKHWYGSRPFIEADRIVFPPASSMRFWPDVKSQLDPTMPRTTHIIDAWSTPQK